MIVTNHRWEEERRATAPNEPSNIIGWCSSGSAKRYAVRHLANVQGFRASTDADAVYQSGSLSNASSSGASAVREALAISAPKIPDAGRSNVKLESARQLQRTLGGGSW